MSNIFAIRVNGKKTIKTDLDYYDGQDKLPEGAFRISPSSMSKFFSGTSKWYRENLLGEEGFTSSTATVLGTVVHYIAEMYIKEQTLSDKAYSEIDNYIKKHVTIGYKDWDAEIDETIVRHQYKIMTEVMVRDYIGNSMPTESEVFMMEQLTDNVFIGGSCDAWNADGTVVDFKTTSAKTPPKTMSYGYRMQLLAYAWLYRKRGMKADRIRLVFVNRDIVGDISEKTGKQLKSYPSKVTVLTEMVTKEDMDFIEGVMDIISQSVELWKSTPALRHILAQDARLQTP